MKSNRTFPRPHYRIADKNLKYHIFTDEAEYKKTGRIIPVPVNPLRRKQLTIHVRKKQPQIRQNPPQPQGWQGRLLGFTINDYKQADLLNPHLWPITKYHLYDPETGKLYNKFGREIRPCANGYIHSSFNGKNMPFHRAIWEYVNGKIPEGFEIDHINGNRQDNRFSNLRLVTRSQNQLNRRPSKNNVINIIGVTINKSGNYQIDRFINGLRYSKAFKTKLAAANYSNYLDHLVDYTNQYSDDQFIPEDDDLPWKLNNLTSTQKK